MSLDNANFIAELSITDPPGSDPLSQGDDQIRTIKRATFNSFPNIDAAVTFDAATLNLAAIKNQANVFTAAGQEFKDMQTLKKSADAQITGFNFEDEDGFTRWAMFQSTGGNGDRFTFRRHDAAGVFLDNTWTADLTTNVVDFTVSPTIAGAPIWIAGEIRIFAATASPGTNWFICDGLNGTVDMTDRAMIGSGISVPGTALLPNLIGLTVVDETDNHILTSGQMPAHDHGLLGGSVTGVSAPLLGANARGCLGHGSMTPSYVFTTGFGDNLMQATGLNQGHRHDTPAFKVDVDLAAESRNAVRPFSRVVEYHQYVP